ncbi:keto-hydroxyglutarate-aldolase/keto-deoxy-phosphogluconate aldolase [bacterium 1xD8-48]|nr:keto-hydroxyglutarate-aldolase/keto-deoxy-phosphogluconate aldolase [bacterium 1xD8-48]
MNVAEIIEKLKVVPVIKLDDAKDAVPLGKALVEGGLPVAEITFRTEAAEEAIRRMSGAYPEIAVGAGTLTSVEQAKRALDAGASFFVSPGFHKGITEFAIQNNIPVYPGVCTPTELMMAMEYGLPVVKFFPAGQYGGLKTIKALSGPFPRMKFMPTGGINQGNIREYLAEPCVIACGGSWMVKDDMLKKQDFDGIRQLVSEAVALVSGEGSKG